MPPEPFQWDRRDFRMHERSGLDTRHVGWPPRWRDQHHPDAPPHPQLYRRQLISNNSRVGTLISVLALFALVMESTVAGICILMSLVMDSCPMDLNSVTEMDWAVMEEGISEIAETIGAPLARNAREQPHGSLLHPLLVLEKALRLMNGDPRRMPKLLTFMVQIIARRTSLIHLLNPDEVIASEQPHSVPKKHPDQDGCSVAELASIGKYKKKTCLGSINWNRLKWSRSGSLSSRGSSLSRSSSSKSMGMESTETVAEAQQKKVTLAKSPATDDATGLITFAPAASEEISSRKRRRLIWGEGLAKYEQKKVDGFEDDAMKSSIVIRRSNAKESVQSHAMDMLDKSLREGLLDCALPATPSSVPCSYLPGIEEKETVNAAEKVDNETSNFSGSPSIVSQTRFDGPMLNLESLDFSNISSVSSLVNELLQSGESCSGNTMVVGANKKLLWKSDISKALEMTKSEIDSLENELKSLTSKPIIYSPFPDMCNLPSEEIHVKHFEQVTDSKFTSQPKCVIVENEPVTTEDDHVRLKVENTDDTGCMISKCAEVLTSVEDVDAAQKSESMVNLNADSPSNLVDRHLTNGLCDGKKAGDDDYHECTVTKSCPEHARACDMHSDVVDTYDPMLASNKYYANGASKALNLNKLLPCGMDSGVSCSQSNLAVIKENFLKRKRSLRFKEKVLTVKYKSFHYFWLQGRLVSVRRLQALSQKKSNLIGHKKQFLGRSRTSASAGNSQRVLAEDVIDFVNGLLAETSFQPCRNTLKIPALILDKKEMQISRFISNNGFVEDPCAVEAERTMINTWTSEEKDIFMDKLAIVGKDFRKIASFLDHKTTADSVEFYYKNHKLDWFEKGRKKPDVIKQIKSQSTTYLVASVKRRDHEASAGSLDILGAASAIMSNGNTGPEFHQKCASRVSFGAPIIHKAAKFYDGSSQRSSSPNLNNNEREVVAADVLAGICGSISSEAMSSCIPCSVDPVDGYRDWRCRGVGFSMKLPSTPDVTQSVDDEWSNESCVVVDPTDWNDVEKSVFIQSLSTCGKDFEMIAHSVRTRSRDKCKIFFSKARKCLGLDLVQPGLGNAVSRE